MSVLYLTVFIWLTFFLLLLNVCLCETEWVCTHVSVHVCACVLVLIHHFNFSLFIATILCLYHYFLLIIQTDVAFSTPLLGLQKFNRFHV